MAKDCLLKLPARVNDTFYGSHNLTMLSASQMDWLRANITANLTLECDKDVFLSQNSEGSGLAFIAMNEAVNQMPASVFFSFIFFFMMVTLGLDSMYGCLEGILTSLKDVRFIRERVREEFLILRRRVRSADIQLVCCRLHASRYCHR